MADRALHFLACSDGPCSDCSIPQGPGPLSVVSVLREVGVAQNPTCFEDTCLPRSSVRGLGETNGNPRA